ncbi:MAG: hypothetical protein GC159_02125 [Phycisphaera sp.]|nr:hypothetical protein [Phycisphaera sp.]
MYVRGVLLVVVLFGLAPIGEPLDGWIRSTISSAVGSVLSCEPESHVSSHSVSLYARRFIDTTRRHTTCSVGVGVTGASRLRVTRRTRSYVPAASGDSSVVATSSYSTPITSPPMTVGVDDSAAAVGVNASSSP